MYPSTKRMNTQKLKNDQRINKEDWIKDCDSENPAQCYTRWSNNQKKEDLVQFNQDYR